MSQQPKSHNHFTVYEHDCLFLKRGPQPLNEAQLKALQKFYGTGEHIPYFTLIKDGIKFKQYVGVLQVGRLSIEVLPKADRLSREVETDKKKGEYWRNMLINMLKRVGGFAIHSSHNSQLKIKPNSILELYFAQFVTEVEYLLQRGLIKKYKQREGNQYALRGSLVFSKHITQNVIHQERFYVRHSSYEVDHVLHRILYKTIKLLHQLNTSAALQSRIAALLLHFPELPDINISPATFERIHFYRKSAPYNPALLIAKLLLLRYHPDLQRGREHVLALLFNMNLLWEKFLLISLRRGLSDFHISAPRNKTLGINSSEGKL